MVDTEKQYWIGFNLVKGIGPSRLKKLLNHFGDVKTAWMASQDELRAAGLGNKITNNLIQARASMDLEGLQRRYETQDIHVLTWNDEAYPAKLHEIEYPPPVLYIRGQLKDVDQWAVAVVGTRRVTKYGRQVTAELVTHLVQSGVTVVSGMARGVDAVAHQTALNAGGRTIAVLGCGVDRIYPPEHRRMAEAIIQQGALISDYAPGTPPEGQNFPPRNRIISGLSLAVVIVEAGKSSGALITANFAVEHGRDVFAVPGHITAPQSKGPNWLIQQGARPLLAPQDILEFLDLTRIAEHREARATLPVNEAEAQLLQTLGREPIHIDEISVQTKTPVAEVSATLTMMELKGMVRQVGGMHYVAVREAQAEYRVEEKDTNLS